MPIYEGLGYTLRDYDPCFNYNQDRFCCSNRGASFRENILLSNCALTSPSKYTTPRYNDPYDPRPLSVKLTGLFDGPTYTMQPLSNQPTWCSRQPCSVDTPVMPPCQKYQPRCNNPATCGKTACGK